MCLLRLPRRVRPLWRWFTMEYSYCTIQESKSSTSALLGRHTNFHLVTSTAYAHVSFLLSRASSILCTNRTSAHGDLACMNIVVFRTLLAWWALSGRVLRKSTPFSSFGSQILSTILPSVRRFVKVHSLASGLAAHCQGDNGP